MFETLQNGLSSAMKSLTGKGKLTESNMKEGLELVQDAMLEADVSYSVVKHFVDNVSERAAGEKVIDALNPTEQLLGIVYQELIDLMGPVNHEIPFRDGRPSILMMCGLQGAGKTTTCGKLAKRLKANNKKIMLVAADLQRPAAIEQLKVLGESLNVPVFSEPGCQDPVGLCQRAVKQAQSESIDLVILDTAGRLHVDDELMQQLIQIDTKVSPDEVLLVVDAMTGQDAVNSADAFNKALELNGVILTKLDGDARGGAALSVKHVTGVPIKFIGEGEKLDEFQEFHPDRMASRILGGGDMATLVEKAHDAIGEDELQRQQELLSKGQFTLEDFRKMMKQFSNLGPMSKIVGMIPGMGALKDVMGNPEAESGMKRMGGIIDSMTPSERRNPSGIDNSRRRRIAKGSGVEPHEVNELVKQFDAMAGIMKGMSGKNPMQQFSAMRSMANSGMMPGSPGLSKPKQSTGKRLTSAEKKLNQKKSKKQKAKSIRDLRRR
jgi:signal recognition particle subunit SRP54